ncbi:LOW QUALITY PROTEIN: 6,7-dimethyl-8-ribityllumazine synthase [Geomicrobium sp. JCM 19037]|nr:LOW QUALITY PROTEIN: 6,7-dimethyl-8-ribityllumazine synthase [Geomicrobium sp. JCM 19037]
MEKTYRGTLDGRGLKIAIVKANFNEMITNLLMAGAKETLVKLGVKSEDIHIVEVPGAFEIPFAARKTVESQRYNGVIALGAVIRGETSHYDYVCQAVTSVISSLNIESDIPITFGVLTTDTSEQALARTGIKHPNTGNEAARTVVEMATLEV